jgi:hypothetical protein
MMPLRTLAALFAFAGAACAETSPSPYAGEQLREIKALSATEQADLLAGRGMGLARAAELNGYPGPKHVLELAGELELSDAQRADTEALFAAMQRRAQRLGRDIVDAERALDALFASREATPRRLSRALARIGALQGALRDAHLAAHLDQARLLSAAQIHRYAALRGYGDARADHSGHAHHH